ncbi:helix-hairpin-helix domain-containing protein [Natranaerofaba carboxydovora]|uniref:helix-hairpin-helix domain-containing protein n=1 Tax=Natranaerofaba carboxydovora TaxID=2742683 RepID=UPI003B845D10
MYTELKIKKGGYIVVDIVEQVSKEQDLKKDKVNKVVKLIKEDGNTIPFVARYRKNETGNMSEDDIRNIIERWEYINNLETRKKEIIETLKNREKLTPELERAVNLSNTQHELEELYKPYKQKKKTRGMKAEEKGLSPLADIFLKGEITTENEAQKESERFLEEEKGVTSYEEALQGANDIIAEKIAQKSENRKETKDICENLTKINVELKDKEKDKKGVYKDYYEFGDKLIKLPSHRIMAINRGEKEGVLKVKYSSPEQKVIDRLSTRETKGIEGYSRQVIEEAVADSVKRLIVPSIERELKTYKLEEAEGRAINIFSKNLENLLMKPPIKGKVIMGVDPAYKTGCKLAVIDSTGDVKEVDVIYPTKPHSKVKEAEKKVLDLIKNYNVKIIAIGNGTASRETEEFVVGAISSYTKETGDEDVQYAIVSEDGASVYSASKLASEEFPELDVQERSAISIARRVLDPLAELVKIDPGSIGVGQYQHDVSKKKLEETLSFVVEKVVNQVGVDVNTASVHLLKNISGLNKKSAENIVEKRTELQGFDSRKVLKQVKGLGDKTFEQCAGFLRILNGENSLDKTAIHPESYHLATELLDIMQEKAENIGSSELIEKITTLENDQAKIEELADKLETDYFTLKDILSAFKKPHFDPRDKFDKPRLKKDILKIEDLKEGMVLEGEIKNVVDFGAFVDLGIKEDGLIHISNLSDKYIAHPFEVVSVGNIVRVEIIDIDKERGRIGLRKV